jgi:hypothetical protein
MRETHPGVQVFYSYFTDALLLLYWCFTPSLLVLLLAHALLVLYLCFTPSLLMLFTPSLLVLLLAHALLVLY